MGKGRTDVCWLRLTSLVVALLSATTTVASAKIILNLVNGDVNEKPHWSVVVDRGTDPPGTNVICFVKDGTVDKCSSTEAGIDYTELQGWQLFKTASTPMVKLVEQFINQNGERRLAVRMWSYRPDGDAFEEIFSHQVEVKTIDQFRIISDGPLAGDVVVVTPPQRNYQRYRITVYRLSPTYEYSNVLEYLGRTRLHDGNPLPVIDSEMPIIEMRLGFWKAGDAPPKPDNIPWTCKSAQAGKGEESLFVRDGVEDCQRTTEDCNRWKADAPMYRRFQQLGRCE